MSIRVAHIISNLNLGGCENTLLSILSHRDRSTYEHLVINMTSGGALRQKFEEQDVRVLDLNLRASRPTATGVMSLIGMLRRWRPDVVKSWMYHADLISTLCRPFVDAPFIWGVHHCDLSSDKRLTRLTAIGCAVFSGIIPEYIVFASARSEKSHSKIGYRGRHVVIPNGYDTQYYRPDLNAGMAVREQCGIPERAPVVTMVGRYHVVKGHKEFFEAARLVSQRVPEAHFVLCGTGVVSENGELAALVSATGLENRVHLLGLRNDVPAIFNASSVNVLASLSEAFPNVVSESMACGRTNVVTDVGDAAFIVGETGLVVPPSDNTALAAGILTVIAMGEAARSSLGAAARNRIETHFTIQRTVRTYERLFSAVCCGEAAPAFEV